MKTGIKEIREAPFQVRAEPDGKLRGKAVVFNSETIIGGVFREVIRPGAFTKSLQERNIRLLWQHDTKLPMGSTKHGTLVLRQTDEALEVENDPPKKAPYDGYVENIQRGDVDSMSFGFEVVQQKVTRGEEGEMDLREIIEAKLFEVSPVTFPAYGDTEIAQRAAEIRSTWADPENNDASLTGEGQNTDEDGATRTTSEAGTSAPTEAKPDGVPDYILDRCELNAALMEIS